MCMAHARGSRAWLTLALPARGSRAWLTLALPCPQAYSYQYRQGGEQNEPIGAEDPDEGTKCEELTEFEQLIIDVAECRDEAMRLEAAAKDNKGKKKDATADMEREMQDKATKKAYGAMTDEELTVSARCACCPLPPPQV